MTNASPTHAKVRRRLAGLKNVGEVRYRIMADRIVDADLAVGLIAPGSLEPITYYIVSRVHAGGPLEVEKLSRELYSSFGLPPAVLAEILHVLERAGDLSIDRDHAGRRVIVRSLGIQRPLNVSVHFRDEYIQYLPAAGLIKQELLGDKESELTQFVAECPRGLVCTEEWQELYEEHALGEAIASAYKRNFGRRFAGGKVESELRDEVLQRSQLLPTRAVVIDPRVIEVRRSELFQLHSAYLYSLRVAGSIEWKALVYVYPDVHEQFRYSNFLNKKLRDRSFATFITAGAARI